MLLSEFSTFQSVCYLHRRQQLEGEGIVSPLDVESNYPRWQWVKRQEFESFNQQILPVKGLRKLSENCGRFNAYRCNAIFSFFVATRRNTSASRAWTLEKSVWEKTFYVSEDIDVASFARRLCMNTDASGKLQYSVALLSVAFILIAQLHGTSQFVCS